MNWQPIETAPKGAQRVLVTNGRDVAVGFFDDERREWMNDSGWVWGRIDALTHWQPLPEPPA